MTKLFHAGFARLRKNRLSGLLFLFSIGMPLFTIYTQYSDMQMYEKVVETEQLILNYGTIAGIVMAVFTSRFLGAEYSDGTIRNKISIGHRRIHIYLAHFLMTAITGLFAFSVWIATVSIVGLPLFGGITMPFSELLASAGCICVAVVAYCAVFTMIAMAVSEKAVAATVSILLAFGLLVVAMICFNRLNEPQFIEAASVTNGDTGEYETIQEPNPRYLSEQERKMYQVFVDINPAGQMFQLAGRVAPNRNALPLYSLGLAVAVTAAGIMLFEKKDIR